MAESLKITDLLNKANFSNSKHIPPPKISKEIPMLSIRNIIITSTGLGIPWLVLLILCAILIFI
jgi:hypothetical protein